MKKFIKHALLFATLIYSLGIFSVTRTSVNSGNWTTASIWNPAGAPACGDSIIIQATHTVCISNQQNYNSCAWAMKLIIYGDLKFLNGSKLSLPCNSYVLVYLGGKVSADVGLSNSNLIEICNKVEWNSNYTLNGPNCIAPTHPVCAGILPVELTSFSADACDQKICLNWETANEINNDHFELERSRDGISFGIIAAVRSKYPNENSYVKTNYSLVDEQPLNGINYYRLMQVDKDGTSSYSKIIAVTPKDVSGLQFSVFPSINSGEFTAQINGLRNPGYVGIILRDQTGTIIYKLWQHLEESSRQIKVATGQKLSNGVYFCSFITAENEQIVKLIVTN